MTSSPHPRFRHQLVIPFQDADVAGMLFFAHLFRYAHEAYERFMFALGHPLAGIIGGGGCLLPLAHAEADYRRPMRLGEPIRIDLGVGHLGESSFRLHYLFLGGDGQLSATAETVHVTFGVVEKRPVAIPPGLRKALEPYLLGDMA